MRFNKILGKSMQIQAHIQKWGNGLGLRVSGVLRDVPDFQVDDEVQIEVTEQGFSVTKIISKKALQFKKYTEAELLENMTPSKIHADELVKPLPQEWL